jgi:hypothetical protein
LHFLSSVNTPTCFGCRQSDPVCCKHKATMFWIYHSLSLELILVFEDDWKQKISKTVLHNNNNNFSIFAYNTVHCCFNGMLSLYVLPLAFDRAV